MFTVLHRKHDAHEDGIWSVAWTSTNKIVTGSVDEYVKVWKVKDSKEVEEESKFEVSWGVIQVAAEKSGRYVASSSLDSKIRIWDLSKGNLSQTINASPLETWGISWNGDGTKIASGSKNGNLNIWNLSTSDREQSLDTSSSSASKFLLSTSFSPSSSFLASGSIDGHVSLFSVSPSSTSRLHSFQSHSLPVRALSFSHDSSTLISGSDDTLIHLYDVETGQLKGTLSGHNSWVLSVCTVGTKGMIASGGSDKTVKIWDTRSGGSSGGCVHSFSEHEGAVWGVAYGESGHLVSVGDDKSIVVYSISGQ
eukprot:TRINITY_DN868_c1_g3_i1.p1 TRINITY_DN868_c1_g3~~TRINITY_DN868_c1_g3_i1.p1  ORF type:complete len:326 (-),score=102.52 TRINITY_DN868_c1_g3_i1:20-943(-)